MTKEFSVTSYGRTVTGEKSGILSILINFFLPGIGIIYAGNTLKGAITFVICLILEIAVFIFLGVSFGLMEYDPFLALTFSIISLLFSLIYIVPWIYSMIVGYQMCKENNKLWTEYLQ